MAKQCYHSRGMWTMEEKRLFLVGLKRFGRGHWKQIGSILKTRSTIQIKSHGQKILLKKDAGINIYSPLCREVSPRRTVSDSEDDIHDIDNGVTSTKKKTKQQSSHHHRRGLLKKRSHRAIAAVRKKNESIAMEARDNNDSMTAGEASFLENLSSPITLSRRDVDTASILCDLRTLMQIQSSPAAGGSLR